MVVHSDMLINAMFDSLQDRPSEVSHIQIGESVSIFPDRFENDGVLRLVAKQRTVLIQPFGGVSNLLVQQGECLVCKALAPRIPTDAEKAPHLPTLYRIPILWHVVKIQNQFDIQVQAMNGTFTDHDGREPEKSAPWVMLAMLYVPVPFTVIRSVPNKKASPSRFPSYFGTLAPRILSYEHRTDRPSLEPFETRPTQFLSQLLFELCATNPDVSFAAQTVSKQHQENWNRLSLTCGIPYTVCFLNDPKYQYDPNLFGAFINCFPLEDDATPLYEIPSVSEIAQIVSPTGLAFLHECDRVAMRIDPRLRLFSHRKEETISLPKQDDETIQWLATMAYNSNSMQMLAHNRPHWIYFYTHMCRTRGRATYEFSSKLNCLPKITVDDRFKQKVKEVRELGGFREARRGSSAVCDANAPWFDLAACVNRGSPREELSRSRDRQRQAAIRLEGVKRRFRTLLSQGVETPVHDRC